MTSIRTTVESWFDGTIKEFTTCVPIGDPVDEFLLSALLVSKKYVIAALLLIEYEHKMPAKAILRILFELSLKTYWCLGGTEKVSRQPSNEVQARWSRWKKDTLCRRMEELKKWRSVPDAKTREFVEDQLGQLTKAKKDADWRDVSAMPQLPSLLDELPKEFKAEVYPKLYLAYNDAIHVDAVVLRRLIRYNGETGYYADDSPESPEQLGEGAVGYALMVNTWVRDYYGWACDSLTQEGRRLLDAISNEKRTGTS